MLSKVEMYSSMSGHFIFSSWSWMQAFCAFWESRKWVWKFWMKVSHEACLSSAGWRVSTQSNCCSVHLLTSGPLIQVSAMAILLMNDLRDGTSWLTMKYVFILRRKLSALARSPSKMEGRAPSGLLSPWLACCGCAPPAPLAGGLPPGGPPPPGPDGPPPPPASGGPSLPPAYVVVIAVAATDMVGFSCVSCSGGAVASSPDGS